MGRRAGIGLAALRDNPITRQDIGNSNIIKHRQTRNGTPVIVKPLTVLVGRNNSGKTQFLVLFV